MTAQTLQEIKRRLKQEQKKLAEEASRLEEGFTESLGETTGELSAYDNHPADLGSETFERSKDLALADQLLVTLGLMDRALQKIADGSYGNCESCHKEIDEARLLAVPYAPCCLECEKKLEAGQEDRPLEEVLLSDRDDYYSPALMAVMRYGSSDSSEIK